MGELKYKYDFCRRSLQDLGLPTRLRSAQVPLLIVLLVIPHHNCVLFQVPLVSSLISVKHKDSSKDERNILQHFAVSSTAFVGVIHYVCKIFCDVLHILSKLSFFPLVISTTDHKVEILCELLQ